MADTATGVADLNVLIKVEEVAPSTKKISFEIPAEQISARVADDLSGVLGKAAIPGFRPGKAPQRLVEKRFGKQVRDDAKNQLIRESYQKALKDNALDVLGEPVMTPKFEEIQLPESGPMIFSCEVELRPTINLPELKGIPVKRAKVEVTDVHLQQAMDNLRQQQGTLVPVDSRGLEPKDYVTADVTVSLEGNQLAVQNDAQFILQPGRVGGIFVEDIDKQLAGLKIGEARTLDVKAPEDHPQEPIRGKQVQIGVTLKDIKRLELAEINQEFLDGLGIATEQELKDALKEQMEIRIKNDVQQGMRDQVIKHLLETVKIDLPEKLSTRQAIRVAQQRANDLMMRGVPKDQIEANFDKIAAGADQQAKTELKSLFILDKVAQQENIDVMDSELNGQLAYLAMQTGERPEKLKQRMDKDGTLMNMYIKMRQNKAIDKILESAIIEEVAVTDEKKA